MIRYILSNAASKDMDDIRSYLLELPRTPGGRIAAEIKLALRAIAANPYQGRGHSDLTRIYGQEIRSWPVNDYRVYYQLGRSYPEIIAVLHAARDHDVLLRQRIH